MKFIKYLSFIMIFAISFFIKSIVLNYNEKLEEVFDESNVLLPSKNDTEIVSVSNTKSGIIELDDQILDKYIGIITGYGADCAGCSGSGYLSCRTKSGKRYSIVHDDIYYDDKEYGKARILAADHKKFPCGTIIKVTTKKKEFIGIVMDTGATMREAWNNGKVWIDVAFKEEEVANKQMPKQSNVMYEVLRYGWN